MLRLKHIKYVLLNRQLKLKFITALKMSLVKDLIFPNKITKGSI